VAGRRSAERHDSRDRDSFEREVSREDLGHRVGGHLDPQKDDASQVSQARVVT
jgi:hypothetical protein